MVSLQMQKHSFSPFKRNVSSFYKLPGHRLVLTEHSLVIWMVPFTTGGETH